jgi:chromosome partitioning protein
MDQGGYQKSLRFQHTSKESHAKRGFRETIGSLHIAQRHCKNEVAHGTPPGRKKSMNRRTMGTKEVERLAEILKLITITVILNFKGGIGKSTLAINLAGYLASKDRRVFLIDGDLQANSSGGLLKSIHKPTLVDVLRDQASMDEAIRKARPNLWILPSDINMDRAASYISDDLGKLRRLLHELLLQGGILDKELGERVMPEFILIDTASLNPVTKAAILCAKDMIVPIEYEFFSFQGIMSLMSKVTEELDRLNHGLDIKAIIPFKVNERRRLTGRYYKSLRSDADLRDSLYPPVHIDVKIPMSQEHTMTIFEYAPDSRGAVELETVARYYLGELDLEEYLRQLDAQAASEEEAASRKKAARGKRTASTAEQEEEVKH